ncbi:MAG: hypothetical protein SFZ02_02215 [bacterium]|nr:hypothetical protein [bacterium]
MANDWKSFFTSVAQVGFLVGVGYMEHSARENQIDQLVRLPLERGIQTVIQSVPQMDNDGCLDFQRRLATRAPYNQNANALLALTKLMVQAENQVIQIVKQYQLNDAIQICATLLQQKQQIEQIAFVAYLQYLSQRDLKAQAIFGALVRR